MTKEERHKALQSIHDEQEQILAKATLEKRELTNSEIHRWDELDRRFYELKNSDPGPEELAHIPFMISGRGACDPEEIRRALPSAVPGRLGGAAIEERSYPRDDRGRIVRGAESYRFDPKAEGLRHAFNRWLLGGYPALSQGEFRALQGDSDIGGGFLLIPQETAGEIVRELDNTTPTRQLARLFTTNAQALSVPVLANDVDDPDWTAEISNINEDVSMSFEARSLTPHPLSKFIKVSRRLLRQSSLNPEALIRERLTQKVSTTLEAAYMTGSGSNQPLGVFTASDYGITTARDVTGAVTGDNLHQVVSTLKPQYRRNARWLMHRDVFLKIQRLKSGDGQYLLQPGLAAGAPNTLLGFEIVLSEYAPSDTTTSGAYQCCFGDFQNYWVADSLQFEIQVLQERFAETSQVAFIIRMESDGMPVLEEGFVRLKLS